MVDVINHKDLAQSRLATEFSESENLINYIRTLLEEADDLETVFQDLVNKRWIDTAEGINLDILGAIVGQPRVIIDGAVLEFFGFDGAPAAGSFGDEDDTSKGARFINEGEETTGQLRLADEEYRLFIRSRILRNSTEATADDVAQHVSFLVGAASSYVADIATATARVYVGKLLTATEKNLIQQIGLIPKPAGVRYEFVEYNGEAVFAFSGVPGAAGFADESTPTVGGSFASEF